MLTALIRAVEEVFTPPLRRVVVLSLAFALASFAVLWFGLAILVHNTSVLGWWQRHQPQAKLICMGTSCSYDPARELSEENYLGGEPIDSLYTYAMTKRMLQVGLLALHKQYRMNYFDPGENSNKSADRDCVFGRGI